MGIRVDGTLATWPPDPSFTPPTGTFVDVAGGESFLAALRNTGEVVVWGPAADMMQPPAGVRFKAITAGLYHIIAIREDNTLSGWASNNSFGQASFPGGEFATVSAGDLWTLGLRLDGTLVAWGDNSRGQTVVPRGYYEEIAAGYDHGLAIPGCPSDFNRDGGVDGQDIVAFFAAWEAGEDQADMSVDGGVDSQDVETFFLYWQAGC
jgi:hypothetical protein